MTSRAYGGALDPATTPRKWTEEDAGILFNNWAVDLGGRISYNFNHITFSFESWFSIMNITAQDLETYVYYNTRRFQLLVGYRL